MSACGCRRVFRSRSTGTPIFPILPPTRSISDSEGEMSRMTISDLNAGSKDDFVRRHTRDSILRDFERRLPNDAKTEMQTSIEEICRIAALRIDQLVLSEDRLPVHGRLSTHVLDTHSGRPAVGVVVELVELSERGANRVVPRPVTNADGRTDRPLIGGRPVPIGRYELTFPRRAFFSARPAETSDPPLL